MVHRYLTYIGIIGRVHGAPIQIGSSFFPCSFTILENQGVEFLLGLDMLKRHQVTSMRKKRFHSHAIKCCLDLKENILKIGSESVPFLAEKDIPRNDIFDHHSKEPAPSSTPQTTNQRTPSTNPSSINPKPSSSSVAPVQQEPSPAVKQLMDLGFPKEAAVNALRMFHGDVESAASYLFTNM